MKAELEPSQWWMATREPLTEGRWMAPKIPKWPMLYKLKPMLHEMSKISLAS